jgi:2-oxoisovalerate dehydrogenase E1 component
MDKELFRRAALIRQFEEKLLALFSQGKLSGTVHTCIGQELCALAVINQLEKGDWVFSNHRCHGHYLAWTGDVRGLLAEIMGKSSGICAGRGGSQHLYRDKFLSNGVQGGAVPIAAGCALALKGLGTSRFIAAAFIGDGTLGQGVVYETLNLASKLGVPLLIVLEKNGYAQSTNTTTTIAGTVGARFEAFGWRYWEGAIWQEEELLSKARAAVDYVRQQRAPAALCINCYRLKAHSKGDDNRDPNEIAAHEERDPLRRFESEHPEAAREINVECADLLARVQSQIEAEGPGCAPAATTPGTEQQKQAEVKGLSHRVGSAPGSALQPTATWQIPPQARIVERLRAGLRWLLQTDQKVVVLGEDVEDPYGGAFKVTKGLSTEFAGRVRNTPISEAAIVGVGNGLALAGMRPVVEVMFGDFITLAADQLINQASKFAYMYNGQVSVPAIIRAAMGGKRGYGATHSQCLEKHFFGTPGLSIVAVNSICDPAMLLARVHERLAGPCLFVENKLLYARTLRRQAPDGRAWQEDGAAFPTLKLAAPAGAELTIVAYGGMVEDVEEAVKRAFSEREILCEVVVPTMLYPLDIGPIVGSVSRTRRLLVVEEGQGFAGFGSEVVARCAEQLGGQLAAAGRVYAAEHPIPCSKELEQQALPDGSRVLEAMEKLVNA